MTQKSTSRKPAVAGVFARLDSELDTVHRLACGLVAADTGLDELGAAVRDLGESAAGFKTAEGAVAFVPLVDPSSMRSTFTELREHRKRTTEELHKALVKARASALEVLPLLRRVRVQADADRLIDGLVRDLDAVERLAGHRLTDGGSGSAMTSALASITAGRDELARAAAMPENNPEDWLKQHLERRTARDNSEQEAELSQNAAAKLYAEIANTTPNPSWIGKKRKQETPTPRLTREWVYRLALPRIREELKEHRERKASNCVCPECHKGCDRLVGAGGGKKICLACLGRKYD